MKKMNTLTKFAAFTIYTLFLCAFLFYVFFSVYTKYKMKYDKELIYSTLSEDQTSEVKVFQVGGEFMVYFTTPMEIQCVSERGTTTIETDVKNGHMIKKSKFYTVAVQWNDSQTGGKIVFPNNYHTVSFMCE